MKVTIAKLKFALRRLITAIEEQTGLDEAVVHAKKLLLSKSNPTYKERREKGLCLKCGKKAVEGHAYCRKCGRAIRIKQRKRIGARPRGKAGCGRPYVY